MADDVSEGWGKWLSFEVLVSIVLAAIAWGVLTSKVSGLEDQVKDQKTVQATEVVESKKVTDDLGREVNQINRKVDVLGTNQEHFKAQINRVDDRLEKIQEILEQQH